MPIIYREHITLIYRERSHCEARSILKFLDSWIHRRLRSILWKQWGRRGYRELRKRGVSVRLAWNTSKSAHGPWRISRSPALNFCTSRLLLRFSWATSTDYDTNDLISRTAVYVTRMYGGVGGVGLVRARPIPIMCWE